jgi:uncharacterized protein YxeA
MKKAILAILTLILIIIAGLLVAVAMQSDEMKVVRSAEINAPPEKIFELVNDFHNWDKWSPWAKLDPNMKATYSGADFGIGSSYAWSGNDEVGEGNMTIKANHPPKYIGIDLEFIKPFAAKNLTEFAFKQEGEKTNVTWSMIGKKNFLTKAFCMVMDMDKMVGGDFEKGLAQMKTVAESAA